MRAWLGLALLLAAPAAAALALPPALPPPGPVVLAVPGSWLAGFTPPAIVAVQGQPLFLANEDIMRHNFLARDPGPDTAPWCGRFVVGACPLFWSELADFGEVVPVLGLEQLGPMQAYDYYCELHTGMSGKIVVAPAP